MIFERIKSEGIAHNSYYIGADSEAVVIDPRRDCQVYIDLARHHAQKIKYVFETHRHEDFVIGSIELSSLTGATVYHGAGLEWKYGNIVGEGEEFQCDNLSVTALATPGHTDESMSYIITDRSSGEATIMVFTGDALFVGDTGRTDLYGAEETGRLASDLFDSIHNKLLPLGDGVILCPAHGAGSVCGINISSRDESTLGIERLQNPALQITDKNEFIKYKQAEHLERPHYFRTMEAYNLEGPPLLGCIPMPAPLTPQEFKKEIEKGGVVIDTSEPATFGGAHIKGSYSIWLEGLPVFAGWVVSSEQPILLVLEEQTQLEKAVLYLIRAGYDNIVGFVKEGIEGWYNAGLPTENLPLLSVHQLKTIIDSDEKIQVLDTREDEEWKTGHIEGAIHIYVGHLEQRLDEIPKDVPVAVICSVGHRAGLGASILLRNGFKQVCNVLGSVQAWTAAGFPVVND
jgi:hydroxyacylglutathione hydrolase